MPAEQGIVLDSIKALDGNVAGSKRRKDLQWMIHQVGIAAPKLRSEQVDADKGHKQEVLFRYYIGDRSKLTMFEMQTFKRWKSMMEFERVRHPRRQRRRSIIIQPISWRQAIKVDSELEGGAGYCHKSISDAVLECLRQFCAAFYSGMEVQVCAEVDLSDVSHLTSRVHSSTNRRQFLVDDIINYLKKRVLKRSYCVLGVTVVDLYPGPEWNFVLGQACFEKGCGVLSLGRYFNSDLSPLPIGTLTLGNGHHSMEQQEMQQLSNIFILMRVSYLRSLYCLMVHFFFFFIKPHF